ncbi:MAG: T9SS type A sorting domain-containing protein [Saprospiraceae bacterium]|nr:T9SS type A sorting domain-containing protein [Candidatus Opimibacter iunctus]
MRFFTPLLCVALMAINQLSAEGTHQVAPNANIDINGNATTDLAALHINNPSYNSFASYDNPNPQSRLYIHIQDPTKECLYLGFNWAHNNVTSPNPPRINFEYRIKDPNGNVVFGPVTVTPLEANIQTWAEGYTGPMQIHGVGGYDATQVSSALLSSQGWSGKGDYYIEFRDEENNDLLIDFWDITVADCSTPTPVERLGRLWSYNWSIFAVNDFGFPNRPFNGAFYVCAPDPDNENASFVTKIDFNGSGFRPAAFNVAFNSFGAQNTGDVSVDRRSVENTNATTPEYAIFLNDPIDICATASIGDIAIIGVSRCAGEDYCIKFTTTKAGQIDLLLDFDGPDNMYTPGTRDILLSRTVTADEVGIPTCIQWDGLDGLGNPLPEAISTQIPVTIAYAQGIYHFPIYDAELMTNGFMISAVRPAAAVSLLFYDDSNITAPSGSGEPVTQLSGCMPPCHRWTNYTQPNTPGFGNLHTINSWWFSQLIIRQDVFFLPAYYTCEIEGPNRFCSGGTSQLTFKPVLSPAGAEGPEIINTQWSGPGIVGASNESSCTINDGGTYLLYVQWVTSLGDTCSTACEYEVSVDPPLESSIDTLILEGETVEINGEEYSEGGQYIQVLSTEAGCDSILTINVVLLSTIINYNMDDCESFMANGSHMDYSEFVPTYPNPLPCATIVADTLHRDNPQVNKHSCTPGVNNTPGMCVGTLASCTYEPGHEASVIIEVNITPDPDTAVYLTGFSFFEKAPVSFNWISGPSGLNNYPKFFRVRILKNGTEIFLSPATNTSQTWLERMYDFIDNDDFLVTEPTTFRFELLSYCPIGNGATESVWDLDEVNIVAACASPSLLNKSIAGKVTTPQGGAIHGAELHLYDDPAYLHEQVTTTDANGRFIFNNLPSKGDYYIKGYDNRDPRNGVSTLDLIHIQKHLLGIKPFTTPYQMIAADANHSNTVSAIDLLELRKLILGLYTELPHNTSWRFGIADQSLQADFPWIFDETYEVEYLGDDITNADFVGVKIGDINGDVDLGFGSGALDSRSSEQMTLSVSDQPLISGVPETIEITAASFDDVAGLQLSLGMSHGRIVDVIGSALPITPDYFCITPDGRLLMSWNSMDMLTVPAGQVLFSIVVMPLANGRAGDMLSINTDKLSPEAYIGESLDKRAIELEPRSTEISPATNELFINQPNPFAQKTSIRFSLEQDGQASIRLYDLSGKVIFSHSGLFRKGMNVIEVTADQIGLSHGIVVCQLQADGFVATQKMVVVRQ